MIISLSGKIKSGKDLVGSIIQYLITQNINPITPSTIDNFSIEDWINNKQGCNALSYWKIKKFADKLKDMVCLMIGCTREQLEDREFRDKPLGEEWWYYRIGNNINGDLGELQSYLTYKGLKTPSIDYNNLEPIKLTPRLLIQLLGTEAGRNIIHPDIWVNSLMSEYKFEGCKNNGDSCDTPNGNCTSVRCYPNWIITDDRFPNETKRVKKEGGITIRIERDFNLRFPEYQNLEEVQVKDIELHKRLTHFSETALDDYKDWDYIIKNNGSLEDLIEQVRIILIKENII
jgi:hypothetical protein